MKSRIPADVDMPDRIFAGLTLRQIAIAAIDVLAIWGLFFGLDRSVPMWVVAAVAAPVAAAGLALLGAHPSGMPAERFLAFAVGHVIASRGGGRGVIPSGSATSSPVQEPPQPMKRLESGRLPGSGKRRARVKSKKFGSVERSARPNRSAKSSARVKRCPKRKAASVGNQQAERPLQRHGRVRRQRLVAPVVSGDGMLDLGGRGKAAICRASSLNFALRSDTEKRVLTAGFARVLNSLDGPAQFVVHSEPADAEQLISNLESQAARLPNPALATAAFEYADFLRSVTSQGDVLTSNVFVCLREPRPGGEATSRLSRRMDDVSSLIRQLGVSIDPLGPDGCTELIAEASSGSLRPSPSTDDCEIAESELAE